MSPETMLEHLVSFPSVVGRPNDSIVRFLVGCLESHGVPVTVLPGPEGDRSNVFATIGPAGVPGYILSGHLDVVPANEPEWQADPFILRRDGEKLIGRGACDMKGFIAAVLSAVPDLVQRGLSVPIHIALSYDEEAGSRGAPHMIGQLPSLCAPPIACIVGEPSNMTPILRHKGKTALRAVARGLSGHSSRTDLGVNAIHMLVPVLAAAVDAADALKAGPLDPSFEPPYSTLQVGVIRGGEAINIIPASAELHVEARAIAGVDPADILEPVWAAAGPGVEIEVLSTYPPLAMVETHPFNALMEKLSGRKAIAAVSYGTEAGLFQHAGVPTIICGPGDISRAHRPEEFLLIEELYAARALVMSLADTIACAA
jgi:acetylornithine deacetylase